MRKKILKRNTFHFRTFYCRLGRKNGSGGRANTKQYGTQICYERTEKPLLTETKTHEDFTKVADISQIPFENDLLFD